MKVTMLGCGASSGVPIIGCGCVVCTSTNPKDKRTRVSLLVEHAGTSLLIDTSPDIRQQCLANNISSIDAVIYTHDHADHTHGIDDIRPLNYHKGAPIDVYADEKTLATLTERFAYAFKPPIPEYGWFRPAIVSHGIKAGEIFEIGALKIQTFAQIHGKSTSLGIRIGDFAYSTDTNQLDEAAFAVLEGVKTWVVDCLKYTPAPTHSHLEQTLQWIVRVKPELAVLTHMGHEFGYDELSTQLPSGVIAGYDGLQLV